MPLAGVSSPVTDTAGRYVGVLEDVVVIDSIVRVFVCVCCCVLERESEAARCFQGGEG